MLRFTALGALALALLLGAPARAEDPAPPGPIAWSEDVSAAFAQAKADQKVLMICVNAKHVAGRVGEEPAAKGLREVVYQDSRVVAKSRAFVCVMLTTEGSADDFGELRALGISGNLVSPQHIFVNPDGNQILLRLEYWSHGRGESAVEALLGLMEKAQKRHSGEEVDPAVPGPGAVDPAPEGEARVEWIARQVELVRNGDAAERQAALGNLVGNDRGGDCVDPLVLLLTERKKDVALLVAIVRALGRDGLERAALPAANLLRHKDVTIRGNAAVSLEYIGSRQKKVLSALKKAADKEKDEAVANHMYRALGRCGSEDSKIRALLLKKAESAKSEFASYGPVIGLAYFEGDEKAVRGVEKMLKKIGVPGSKRGGGGNTVKRGLVSWLLAAIGDEKSAEFVRKELVEKLEHVQAFWVEGLRGFWEAVARKCDGDESMMPGIEAGLKGFVTFAKAGDLARYGAETRGLMDEFRTDRDNSTFRPKGDGLLQTGG